ncbi:MAG: hypothetical protein Ct9H300mP1_36800 [Planctomycetaceae bacterium]|nr:MAG: hypothetical protein Ct9H300mP1_36800 [Planctomycetaceae bacterium]
MNQKGFQLVLRGGTIIDGTGSTGRRADVAISAGGNRRHRNLDGLTAFVNIDVSGQVVCPGFIDLHSHADRGILKHRLAENYIPQRE